MASLTAFLAPSKRVLTYVPSTISVRAERAILKLLADPESIEERLAHVVDRTALQELRIACEFWPTKSLPTAEKDALKTIHFATRRFARITEDRTAAVRSHRAERLEAERKQFEEPRGTLDPSTKDRERERIYHAERLWLECGVTLDFEAVPGESVDNAEMTLAKIGQARMQAKYCDALIDLRGHLGDLHISFAEVAKDLAGAHLFACPPSVPNEAASFIRELRFMGHGFPGTAELPAAFGFTGELLDTPSLQEKALIDALGKMKNYLAPRSSIILDGCSTGRGARGKEFLRQLGKLFYGNLKHGYLRANTENVEAPPANFKEGLLTVNAVTYLWPDDF